MDKSKFQINVLVCLAAWILSCNNAQFISTCQHKVCPPGFSLYEPSSKCYALITTLTNKDDHIAQCSRLAVGAFIAAPLDAGEDQFIMGLIQIQNETERQRCKTTTWSPTYEGYYLGGESWERRVCITFQWYLAGGLRQKMEYSNFQPGDPNCVNNQEFCLANFNQFNFKWADISCDTSLCSVCEFRLQK